MKKTLFHIVRYMTILFPIMFLIIVLAHTNYYTDRNRIVATNYPIEQYRPKKLLPSNRSLILTNQKGSKIIAQHIIKNYEWKNIINRISNGNNEWTQLIPNILPYTPIKLRKSLDQAILHALLIKPNIILQSLALTNSSLKNTDLVCKAPSLNQNEKLRLATLLQSVHNPSFVYQQQSCLHTLLKAMKHKQNLS